MSIDAVLLLLISSLLAAAGQVMLKYSAVGRAALAEHLNVWLFAGLGCYAAGAVLWIYCLARLPLLKVYPFTTLAFVLTILAGVLVFGEHATLTYWVGLGFILAGLLLVSL
jgi:drug/metabolite transporter (DMT)-like permease